MSGILCKLEAKKPQQIKNSHEKNAMVINQLLNYQYVLFKNVV